MAFLSCYPDITSQLYSLISVLSSTRWHSFTTFQMFQFANKGKQFPGAKRRLEQFKLTFFEHAILDSECNYKITRLQVKNITARGAQWIYLTAKHGATPLYENLQCAISTTGLRVPPAAPFRAEANFNREYSTFPLTVECWVRIFSSRETNIILSNGYRTATGYVILANHREIKTKKDTGQLVVHLQNADPSDLETTFNIAD